MLAELIIKLKKDPEQILSYQMSSLFHGFLMEHVNPEYGDYLHESSLKPFSQHLQLGKEEDLWIINTLNKEAYENIMKPFLSDGLNEIHLTRNNLHILMIGKEIRTMEYDVLMEQTVFFHCPRYVTIQFATPTAFKSNGEYIFFPTIKHIFYSCVQKFDSASENSQIYRQELLEDIEKYVKIVRYRLQSTGFSLEGIKIPAFRGEITIKTGGPQQLVNLVHLLLKFGEYSGIGIKSALGMGSIRLLERMKKDARENI